MPTHAHVVTRHHCFLPQTLTGRTPLSSPSSHSLLLHWHQPKAGEGESPLSTVHVEVIGNGCMHALHVGDLRHPCPPQRVPHRSAMPPWPRSVTPAHPRLDHQGFEIGSTSHAPPTLAFPKPSPRAHDHPTHDRHSPHTVRRCHGQAQAIRAPSRCPSAPPSTRHHFMTSPHPHQIGEEEKGRGKEERRTKLSGAVRRRRGCRSGGRRPIRPRR